MAPTYELEDLKKACAKSKVIVTRGALKFARVDFVGCDTQKSVIDAIVSGAVNGFKFKNTVALEKNPWPEEIMVDAYDFFFGNKYGYMAFYFQAQEKMWYIKSFKQNKGLDPRYQPFKDLALRIKSKGRGTCLN